MILKLCSKLGSTKLEVVGSTPRKGARGDSFIEKRCMQSNTLAISSMCFYYEACTVRTKMETTERGT